MPVRRLLAAFLGLVLVVGLPTLSGASPVRAEESPAGVGAVTGTGPAVPATAGDPAVQPAVESAAPVPRALGSRTLRSGDSGADVAALQKLLKVKATATFDSATLKAVKKVQRAARTTANGVVTPAALIRIKKQLKKQAAAARAAKEASRGMLPRASSPAASKKFAAEYIGRTYGWSSGQMSCLSTLWTRESGWRYWVSNPNGIYRGIPQTSSRVWGPLGFTTAEYMRSPEIQIKIGARYIKGRYGSPCNAWAFWRSHHWY